MPNICMVPLKYKLLTMSNLGNYDKNKSSADLAKTMRLRLG